MSADKLTVTLGVQATQLLPILEELIAEQLVITGLLADGVDGEQLCDAGTFESLLRMARADASPDFQTLPVEQLPLFLAVSHGLHEPGDNSETLRRRLEPLLGFGAPAVLWETEILPARMRAYTTSLLDGVLQESVLRWVGCGTERLAFCFEADLDLLGLAAQASDEAMPEPPASLFPDPHGRYDFATLQSAAGVDTSELTERLWQGVWQGAITNDSYAAVRRGSESKFKPPAVAKPPTRRAFRGRQVLSRRPAGGRWQGSSIYPGSWRLLPAAVPAEDLLEEEERNKDRVRLLLDRYGVFIPRTHATGVAELSLEPPVPLPEIDGTIRRGTRRSLLRWNPRAAVRQPSGLSATESRFARGRSLLGLRRRPRFGLWSRLTRPASHSAPACTEFALGLPWFPIGAAIESQRYSAYVSRST